MTENISIKKLENSQVEIEGEISAEELESHRGPAISKLGADMTVPGFRKGHVPENILVSKVGEMPLLQEMAERALKKEYPKIIHENKISAIGNPEISITKLAPGNPLGFRARTAVVPDIDLPDYKKISEEVVKEDKEKNSEGLSVEDKEVEENIEKIKKSMSGGNENTTFDITDESVKNLGDFKSVSDFKEKLKVGILEEKKRKAREKVRIDILEKVLAGTKMELPEIIVQAELDKMFAQFKGDIERMGLKPADYLKQIKKSEEDLRVEWRPDAEKRAKTQLILNKIAKAEDIKPEKDAVNKEVEHILSHQPKADRETVRVYIEAMLTNELVFEFLEKKS